MSKNIIALLVAGILILGGISTALALGGGNGRKGKYLYRKNCRSCHAEGKGATDLSPVSKTQAAWIKAFGPEAIKGYQCADKFAALSDKDLNDIFTYLHDHAYDSPSPAKCK